MGAAVGTAASAEDGLVGFVHAARQLLRERPTITDAELEAALALKAPNVKCRPEDLKKLRQLHATPIDDIALLAELRTPQEDGTRTAEVAAPRARTLSPEPTLFMATEFKRSNMKKSGVLYPQLPESAPTPFPKSIVGSFSCHGQSEPTKYKENQDRGLVASNFSKFTDDPAALFICADGHGEFGHDVSDYVVRTLFAKLSLSLARLERPDHKKALTEAFIETNGDLAVEEMLDSSTSGTTCVAALVRQKEIWTANVGDSRCTVGRVVGPSPPNSKVPLLYKAHDLTVDHKPDNVTEKARIVASGGYVTEPEWSASARVWLDKECTWPGLAMARSIGDQCVKGIGVTPEPDVSRYAIEPNDRFVVIASDGIWEFLCSDDVVSIVSLQLHKEHQVKGTPAKKKAPLGLAEAAAQEVIKCAIKQWKIHEDGYRDDITATVILLPLFGGDPVAGFASSSTS